MAKHWKNRRDDAGSMLAAVIVIVAGAGLCAFLAAVEASERSDWAIGVVITVAVLLVTWMIWYRYSRDRTAGLRFWLSVSRNHNDDGIAAQYRPRKVADRKSELAAGTNQPITAEEAHEIQATSASTWVPSRNREGGKA